MPSPFPGMDPYMERRWRDVHAGLITYARDALNQRLPRDLLASAEERLEVLAEDDVPAHFVGDVAVMERMRAPSRSSGDAAALTVAEPVVLRAMIEPDVHHYVTIIHAPTGKLITVIECVSPTNKRGGDHTRDYLDKRRQFLDAGVHVVEIDLIRRGDRRALLAPFVAPDKHCTVYRVTVRTADNPGEVQMFPITLRDRLPIIPVPLREQDEDVPLDLQTIVTQIYDNGRYDGTDYRQPLDPPLEGEDAAWADELLKKAGRR